MHKNTLIIITLLLSIISFLSCDVKLVEIKNETGADIHFIYYSLSNSSIEDLDDEDDEDILEDYGILKDGESYYLSLSFFDANKMYDFLFEDEDGQIYYKGNVDVSEISAITITPDYIQ